MDFEPIPGPRGLPFLGNALDLQDDEAKIRAFERLADTYGTIFQITVGGQRLVVVSSAEMMKEVMDEKRFFKTAIPALHEDGKADGLIVAGTADPDWAQGHRILRPVSCARLVGDCVEADLRVLQAFGPLNMDKMFDDMKDIS